MHDRGPRANVFQAPRRQVRRSVGDGLKARLFIHRNGNDRGALWTRSWRLILQGNLLINQQHVPHPHCKGGIASLQIVPDTFGMQRRLGQDPLYGGFGRPAQGRMPRLRCLAPHMPRQQTPRPKFGGVAQFLWLRAGQMDDPRTRFLRDHRSARAMIGILERGVGTHGGRLIDPLSDALAVSLGWRA